MLVFIINIHSRISNAQSLIEARNVNSIKVLHLRHLFAYKHSDTSVRHLVSDEQF